MRVPVIASLFVIGASQACATPPPPPPPHAESLSIAVKFWPDAARLRWQFDAYAPGEVGRVTAIMLQNAKVKLGTSEWREKRERLYGYFWKNIEPQLETKLKPFLECNARPYAYMSVSELEQVNAFLKTVAGQTFWKSAGLEERYMGLCTMEVLRADISKMRPEGWKIIGIKNPPIEYPPA